MAIVDHPFSVAKRMNKLVNIHLNEKLAANEPADCFWLREIWELPCSQSKRRSQYGGRAGWAVTLNTIALSVLFPNI